MSFTDDLLTILLDYSAGYRRMRQLISGREYPSRKTNYRPKDETIRVVLSRLKKNGLVTNNERVWQITKKGREYFQNKSLQLLGRRHAKYPLSQKQRSKNMVIAFDVPEQERRKRDWLRIELVALGFKPIQKSVWFGPSPLPKNFIEALHDLKLLNRLKFFKAEETEIV